MNLLGAVAMDFADQMRRRTKGWVITPLVVWGDEIPIHHRFRGFLHVKRCPAGQSPSEFYQDNPPADDLTFLQVKIAKKPLRLVQFELDNTTVTLTYWRANGFKEPEPKLHKRSRRYDREPENPDEYHKLLLARIFRVGKRNSGTLKFDDSYDIQAPKPPVELVDVVVATINKSFEWYSRGKREDFDRLGYPMAVDLEGRNFEMSHEW